MLTSHKDFKSIAILFTTAGLLGCASMRNDDHSQKFYGAVVIVAQIATGDYCK